MSLDSCAKHVCQWVIPCALLCADLLLDTKVAVVCQRVIPCAPIPLPTHARIRERPVELSAPETPISSPSGTGTSSTGVSGTGSTRDAKGSGTSMSETGSVGSGDSGVGSTGSGGVLEALEGFLQWTNAAFAAAWGGPLAIPSLQAKANATLEMPKVRVAGLRSLVHHEQTRTHMHKTMQTCTQCMHVHTHAHKHKHTCARLRLHARKYRHRTHAQTHTTHDGIGKYPNPSGKRLKLWRVRAVQAKTLCRVNMVECVRH